MSDQPPAQPSDRNRVNEPRVERADAGHDSSGSRPIDATPTAGSARRDTESGSSTDTNRDGLPANVRVRLQQMGLVARLGQAAMAATTVDQFCDDTCRELAAALLVDDCLVWELPLSGEPRLLAASRAGLGAVSAGAGSLAYLAARATEPLTVADLNATEPPMNDRLVRETLAAISALAVVIPGRGRTAGVLMALTRTPRVFARHDISLVQSVANIVAQSIARAAAEEQLRRHEILARSLAMVPERTDLPILILDARGRIDWANQGFYRLTGFHAQDLIGRDFTAFAQPIGSDGDRALWYEAVVGRTDFRGDIRGQRQGQQAFEAEAELKALRNTAGQLLSVMVIMSDMVRIKAGWQTQSSAD